MIKKSKLFSLYFIIFVSLISISFGTSYSASCSGMSFDGTYLYCSSDMIKCGNYNVGDYRKDGTGFVCDIPTTSSPIFGDGVRYLCVKNNPWYYDGDYERVVGYCDLTATLTPTPTPTPTLTPTPTPTPSNCIYAGITIPASGSKTFAKSRIVPACNSCQYNTVSCSSSGVLSGENSEYQYGGSCSVAPPTDCTFNGDIIKVGDKIKYYKFNKVPFEYNCEDTKNINIVSCNSCGVRVGANNAFKERTCNTDGEWSQGVDLNYDDVVWEIKDDYTIRKIKYDSNKDIFKYYNKNKQYENLIMPTVPTINNMKISKNSRNKNIGISKILIALNGHKLKKFHGKDEAQNYFTSTYKLMNDLNIIKNLSTNDLKTNIKISIGANKKENLVLYQIIPKDIITKYSQINFLSDSSSKSFIVDKDPIIGWYFNYSDDEDDYVEYELPGDNEGGTIIITQEPILFNNGELVINYREVKCNADEAYLFDLDDIYDSKLYLPSSNKFYKLCIAHKDYNLVTSSTKNPFMHAFNYTTNGEMSFILPLLKKVKISAQNTTPIYWDMKVQENSPEGNYSCLGSFDKDLQSSNFGDCADVPTSRIWLHLGDDYFSPNTTFSYPYLAHTLKITFEASDDRWGSGVKNIYYCIKNETIDCSNKHDDFTIIDEEKLILTCPNKWGCKKELFYYSKDNFGNIEETNYKELDLIEMGSSCQESCLAAPSPNRYFKNCNNLNNCDYYNYDEFGVYDNGVYVSKICHYLTQDSWAVFNQTHEIMCPSGPFKKSSYSQEKLDLTGSQCEKISIEKRNVLFNGMSVLMKIIICEE